MWQKVDNSSASCYFCNYLKPFNPHIEIFRKWGPGFPALILITKTYNLKCQPLIS